MVSSFLHLFLKLDADIRETKGVEILLVLP